MNSIQPRTVSLPNSQDLADARDIVGSTLRPTPLIAAELAGASIWLKLESLQPVGAFKIRGALVAMSALKPGQRALAVSAGNHALGIAWASQHTGIPATVVIAETASPTKRQLLEALPIELIAYGKSYDEAETFAVELAQKQDDATVFISAYNDPLVIAGQSTILDELVADLPSAEPLTVLVPVGGGGMLAGIALRAEEYRTTGHDIRVIGVEAAASPALSTAMQAGHPLTIEIGDSLADGLTGNLEPESTTVQLAIGRVDDMVQVSETGIAQAMNVLAIRHGVIAEGAGAVTTAALLSSRMGSRPGNVVAIVSGRNVTPAILRRVLGQ